MGGAVSGLRRRRWRRSCSTLLRASHSTPAPRCSSTVTGHAAVVHAAPAPTRLNGVHDHGVEQLRTATLQRRRQIARQFPELITAHLATRPHGRHHDRHRTVNTAAHHQIGQPVRRFRQRGITQVEPHHTAHRAVLHRHHDQRLHRPETEDPETLFADRP